MSMHSSTVGHPTPVDHKWVRPLHNMSVLQVACVDNPLDEVDTAADMLEASVLGCRNDVLSHTIQMQCMT